MIRMVQSKSAGHAKAYFSDALMASDYYMDEQELLGRFHGRLAERLGVKGVATKDVFHSLCENINPSSGSPLTPRTKNDRITGYDINFHCPKSVSILHALAKDDHILEAFNKSVSETMQDIENDSKTRVRQKGVYEDRPTGELIWGEFVHQTSRPVDGHSPDPHLHSHCFVFNATWDNQEKKIKAGKFRDIKRDMPFYQAAFHKRLADNMVTLGYQINRKAQSFEIEGVPQKVIAHFSKRTDEIGRIAKEKGISNAKDLDALGARTRSKKQKGRSMSDLKKEWRQEMQRLTIEANFDVHKTVRFAPIKEENKDLPIHCINNALTHCFERASVMDNRRLLAEAYRYGLGSPNISIEALNREFITDKRLLSIKQGSRTLCTTEEVLSEEKRMVELALHGKGKLTPIYDAAPLIKLKDQQGEAVAHVLTTRDRVSIIRGAAGTGKTTLMREAIDLMQEKGKHVTIVAPTSEASRGVLKEEGFTHAETVAKLLIDKSLQDKLEDQVLWVDEAGLLGTKDMAALIALATEKNAQLILGGDTKQHASVVRGDALRILNTVGGIQAAEVSKIYRQRNFEYKSVVLELSKGQIKDGFNKLDAMGSIKTIDPMNPNEELVDDYVAALKKGKSALVISPTHKQGDSVIGDIRKKLRQNGMIGNKEIKAIRYINLNMTEAQKSDWRNINEKQFIQFNQNIHHFKRGSLWCVKEIKDKKILIEDDNGTKKILPLSSAKYFNLYNKTEIGLSKGDSIKITRNGFDTDKKRLNNGMTLEVMSVSQKGKMLLRNNISKAEYSLENDWGHLAHAYCITSHASQGKTVDEVFISQPSSTFNAADAKQFYVSVSRGKDAAKIYTDDKVALMENVSELNNRQSAIELLETPHTHVDHVHHKQRSEYPNYQPKDFTPDYSKNVKTIEKDYEPSI